MEQVIMLLIIELVFIFAIFVISNGNLLSPAFVSYSLFLLATICILFNINFWDVSFSYQTVGVITLGFFSMLLPEIFFRVVYKSRVAIFSQEYKEIRVDLTINIVVHMLCVLFLLLQIWRIFTIGQFSENGLYAIGMVKHSEESFDIVVKLSDRTIQILGMIYMYICLHNKIRCSKEIKYVAKYIIPVAIYCVSMFFSGNRLGFVKIFAAFYVVYIVMRCDMTKKGKAELKNVIKPMVFLAIIVIGGFFSLRGFSKINSTAASRDFIDYMTYYIGSPTYLFDKYVLNPESIHKSNEVFGQMSLTSLYTTFGINIDNINNSTLLGGESYFAGNEYSWFQRPMADFGIIGMCIFTIVIYGIFDYVLYRKLLRGKNERKRNNLMMIYAYFFYIPFMAFYYCQVCNAFSLFTIVILLAITWGVNNIGKVRVKYGRKYNIKASKR